MSITFEILKLERSRAVKAVHAINIHDMLDTLVVSKLETLSEIKDEQSLNIYAMLVTLAVLKLERLSEATTKHIRHGSHVSSIKVGKTD